MKKNINFSDLLTIGENFFLSGQRDRYLQVMKLGSKLLADLMRVGQVDKALGLEPSFYNKLVKKIESEENYYEGFCGHAPIFYKAGLREVNNSISIGDPQKIVFVAHSSVLLGHTEVMLNILASWKKINVSITPYFIGLTPMHLELQKRLNHLGIKFYAPIEKMSPTRLILWCQSIIKKENISTAIWLSTPCWVSYIFGRRIAYRQVFWSLKFHPYHLGNDVIHIGMAKAGESTIDYGYGKWRGFVAPLTVPSREYSKENITNIKSRILGKYSYIYGTLTRTEKVNNTDFSDALVKILQANKNSVYIYTGMNKAELIESAALAAGISERCIFIGWVDTELYSNIIDVYLDPFPFGSGITGVQAILSGAPYICLWSYDTLIRHYFSRSEDATNKIENLCLAHSVSEYITMSVSAIKSTKKIYDIKNNFFIDNELESSRIFNKLLFEN